MIVAHVLDGAKIQTRIDDKFVIDSDQPKPYGEDSAPAPYDYFLVGVVSCTAFFAQVYCRKWKLPHEGISVELEPVFNAAHVLTNLKLRVRVPDSFPKDHIAGLLRNAAACPVKKALESSPEISVEAIEG